MGRYASAITYPLLEIECRIEGPYFDRKFCGSEGFDLRLKLGQPPLEDFVQGHMELAIVGRVEHGLRSAHLDTRTVGTSPKETYWRTLRRLYLLAQVRNRAASFHGEHEGVTARRLRVTLVGREGAYTAWRVIVLWRCLLVY